MPRPASRITLCRLCAAPPQPIYEPACGLLFHCTVVRNTLANPPPTGKGGYFSGGGVGDGDGRGGDGLHVSVAGHHAQLPSGRLRGQAADRGRGARARNRHRHGIRGLGTGAQSEGTRLRQPHIGGAVGLLDLDVVAAGAGHGVPGRFHRGDPGLGRPEVGEVRRRRRRRDAGAEGGAAHPVAGRRLRLQPVLVGGIRDHRGIRIR